MDNQRLVLFVALSVIVVMLWSAWEKEQRPQHAPVPTEISSTVPAAPQAPSAPASHTITPSVSEKLLDSGDRIEVTTDLFHAEIDVMGGDLRRLDLFKHPVDIDHPKSPFRLMDDKGKTIFVAQSGLIAKDIALANHKSRFKIDSNRYVLPKGQDNLPVRLHWDGPEGVRVTKIYTFHRNEYLIDISYEVSNQGRRTHDLYMYAQLLRNHVDEGHSMMALPSYTGGVVYSSESNYEKISFDEMRKKKLDRQTDNGWVAVIQHYFVGAWLPDAKQKIQFFTDTLGENNFFIGYKTLSPATIAPGGKSVLSARLYVGPKEQKRLEQAAPGLKLTVDYGWLDLIASPLFLILKWLHNALGNWGWAIIVLTLLIKLAFYPLSVASYRSMAKMRKVQPRLQAIKERYGDDRQKLHQAMMEIYKTEKINPLGGCLPILIQIPVFIALYWVLLESIELRQAPWALWIRDLSAPDPFFVLPILMGVSMLVQQWLNPQPLDDMQKKIMYALPIVFTFMFLWFPSGLVLYWVVQNVLSIAQQWQINRAIEGKH